MEVDTKEYEDSSSSVQVHDFHDPRLSLIYHPITSNYYTQHREDYHDLPILIDLGSYELRAGYLNDAAPRLVYRNLLARPAKTSLIVDNYHHIGADLTPDDLLNSNYILRNCYYSTYDGNNNTIPSQLYTHSTTMQQILDYTFINLGLASEKKIENPLALTEPVANPNYCRKKLNELLFECYEIPAVHYGIDSLYSYHYNNNNPDSADNSAMFSSDGLIINIGHANTNIIPIVAGRALLSNSIRISVGTSTLQNSLQQSLCIHYPQFKNEFNYYRTHEILENYLQTAQNYSEQLKTMQKVFDINKNSNPGSNLAKYHCDPPAVTFQIPFIKPVVNEISAEEVAAREKRRQANADRLKLMQQKRRADKISELSAEIEQYNAIKSEFSGPNSNSSAYLGRVKPLGFSSVRDFENYSTEIQKKLNRMTHTGGAEAEEAAEGKKSEEELYPLLSVPDEQLSPDEIKEKRKQKLMKAGAEARKNKKLAKVEEENRKKQQLLEEEAEKQRDPAGFKRRLLADRAEILQNRSQRLVSSSGGGKKQRRGVEQKLRMKMLASVMVDSENAEKDKWFGLSDEDWNIYKKVSLNPGDNEDSESEEELEKLEELEGKLNNIDPNWNGQESAAGKSGAGEEFSGSRSNEWTEEDYRVDLLVNRIRIPEILFQPDIIGLEESGIAEAVRTILARLPSEELAKKLMRNVWITGGGSQLPGLKQRVEMEIMAIRPVKEQIRVNVARDYRFDSWKGMQQLLLSSNWKDLNQFYCTKQQYLELGNDYLTEHICSNRYFKTPSNPSNNDPEDTAAASKRRKR
jgi:actin-related protein 5